jgi:hypothetical protein
MMAGMARDDATEPASAAAPHADARTAPSEPSRTCPNCGAPLLERKCKLICPNAQCGYYMSCSDFL